MTENSIAKDLFNAFKNFYKYKTITPNIYILQNLQDDKEYLSKDRELSYKDYLLFFEEELKKATVNEEKTKHLNEIIEKIKTYKVKKTSKDLILDLVLQIIRSYQVIRNIKISNHKVNIIDNERFRFNDKDYNNTDLFTDYIKLLEVNIEERASFSGGSIKKKGGVIEVDNTGEINDNVVYQFLRFKEKLRTQLFRDNIDREYTELLRIVKAYYFDDIIKGLVDSKLVLFKQEKNEVKLKIIGEISDGLNKYFLDVDKYKQLLVEISNKYENLSELVYIIKDYLEIKFEDFIRYFNYILEEIIRINLVNINKIKSSKAIIDFLHIKSNKPEVKSLRAILVIKENEEVELDTTFLNAKYSDVDKLLDELGKKDIDKIADKKEKIKLRNKLYEYHKLYDYESGEWKKDIKRTKDTGIIDKLQKQQILYDKMMSSFNLNVDMRGIKFTEEYTDLKQLGERLINV